MKWIKVEDQLPPFDIDVLFFSIMSGEMAVDGLYQDIAIGTWFKNMGYTHWMPLPEKPDEK